MRAPTRRQALGGVAALSGAALFPGVARAQETGWAQASPLPIRVQEIYPAVLDGVIYVAGGLSPDAGRSGAFGLSNRMLALEPGARRWRDRAETPLPIHHPNCVGYGDRIFSIGGFTAENGGVWSMSSGVRLYDPENNRWGAGPDMPQPLAETVAAVVAGRIHVATGRRPAGGRNRDWNDHADVNAHLVLDPGSGAWTTARPAPTARNSAAGALLDGRWHVIGGRTVSGGNTAVHEVYDPDRDAWETFSPLPQPALGPRGSGGLAAAVLDGRIFVFGGEWFDSTGGGVYAQVWAYDPAADAWEEAGVMPTPRHGLGAVTADFEGAPAIYTIGGAARAGGNDTSAVVEVFRP